MRRLLFFISVIGLVALMWYLSAPKGHAQQTFGTLTEKQVQGDRMTIANGDGVSAELRATCFPDRLLAALEAAREFVPERTDLIADAPLYKDGLFGNLMIDDGLYHVEDKSPNGLRRSADALEKAETERQARVKRQRAAVETFNATFKECVKSEK